jgi:hypothetical protein
LLGESTVAEHAMPSRKLLIEHEVNVTFPKDFVQITFRRTSALKQKEQQRIDLPCRHPGLHW